jgi:para-aminobenzoate synthetase component 2
MTLPSTPVTPDPVSSFRTPEIEKRRAKTPRVLVLDNYDSFTYNIVQYLELLGARVEVWRNDERTLSDIETEAPNGIVISPGPSTPERSGISLVVIQRLAGRIPIFGVCLGMQALAVAFGGKVVRAEEPIHGRRIAVHHDGVGVLRGLPSPVAMARYNSLIVSKSGLPAELEITARSESGEILALRDVKRRLEGVQFHPESVLSEYGLTVFDNWLEEL